jgi:hypothetical protein
LQADLAREGADGETGVAFRAALDAALAELAHQGAVDVALAQRLGALRDAVVRGAAWAGAERGRGAPARPALPSPARPSLPGRPPRWPPPRWTPRSRARWWRPRAGGVGGEARGHGGADRAALWAGVDAAPADPGDGPRLDLRF